jgi:short-subunit dehydrogenase
VAPLALAQLVIPIMKDQGAGTIVNLGSVAGQVSLPWASAYSASKFALDAIHDALRRELRKDCIHLVKVCPGIVDTEFRNHVLAGAAPPAVRRIRKTVSPDRVASGIIRAVERRHSTVFVPRIGRLFTFVGSVAPFLMDLYLARLSPAVSSSDPPLPSTPVCGAGNLPFSTEKAETGG